MITYKIAHHTPGRIRLDVPFIKRLSSVKVEDIPQVIRNFSFVTFPPAIIDIQTNPMTGSLTLLYKPSEIDIMKFIDSMISDIASNEEVIGFIEGLPSLSPKN